MNSKAPKSLQARTKGQGAQHVYETLREEILALRLEPGLHLEEAALSRRFDMSRTPMREALIRLSAEGLVQMRSNSSARVAPMDINNLREHHEAAELMHRVVARWAAERRSDQDIAKILEAQKACEAAATAGDRQGLLQSNFDFHAAIGAAAGNQYTLEHYLRLLNEGQRYARISMNNQFATEAEQFENIQRILSDHAQIIDAIVAQDPEKADKFAGRHFASGKAQLLQFLNLTGSHQLPLGKLR